MIIQSAFKFHGNAYAVQSFILSIFFTLNHCTHQLIKLCPW